MRAVDVALLVAAGALAMIGMVLVAAGGLLAGAVLLAGAAAVCIGLFRHHW